jgi:hypothetical protein
MGVSRYIFKVTSPFKYVPNNKLSEINEKADLRNLSDGFSGFFHLITGAKYHNEVF